jgi:Ca2+-binding RTX toxin-like protein
MADFAPTTLNGLLTLWGFDEDSNTIARDQAPEGGFEDARLKNGAEAANGVLELDGRNDHAVAGPDDDWQLDQGRIELVFNQDDHRGSKPDTLLSRDSKGLDDGGHLNITVTQDGRVSVRHQDETGSNRYETGKNFFCEGDDVRVTYAWDSNGVDGFFKVENLSQGTVYETPIADKLTLDNGATSEPFTIGAGQTRSSDDSADRLNEFFEGEIAYVAIYATAAPEKALNYVVEGSAGADLIDLDYTGDPEGDRIDAQDNEIGGDADLVDAGAGDDVILAGLEDDTVYAGSGDDRVEGEDGDDLIYGDSALGLADADAAPVRESFNWADLGYGDGDTIPSGVTQDTGSVTVSLDYDADPGTDNAFEDTIQNVADIDSGTETVDEDSSFESVTNGAHKSGSYTLGFDRAVENVSFRVNDIDGDGVVRVSAEGPDGPVEVVLTGGACLTLSNDDAVPGDDTAASQGGYRPDSSEKYSLLVEIAGPVTGITLVHSQDGGSNSGVNITDVFFDVPAGGGPEGPGDDTLIGGVGDDTIFGETGNDSVEGGAGDDTLFGDLPSEGTPVGENLIANGSFEDVTGLTPTAYGFVGAGAIPDWTDAEGAEIDVHNDGRAQVDPTDGDNWLDLEASPGNNRIGQDVAGVQVGTSYLLSFDAGDAFRQSTSAVEDNIVNVYWGGELIATIDPVNGEMTRFEYVVEGGSGDGSNRLEFEGVGIEDNIGASIDSVSLVQLAEASSVAGDDTVNGGLGDDLVDGGRGDDLLIGGAGDDTVLGGVGDDTLRGNAGADSLDGGTGDDDLGGAEGNDTLQGGAGDDTLTGGSGDDSLDGGTGDDSIQGNSGNDAITDLSGDNNVEAGITGTPDRGFPNPFGTPPVVGADSDPFDDRDTVITGAGDDLIETGDDNDVIASGGGDDTIDAGFDDDNVQAGAGDDFVISGEGSDTVRGGAGDDTIYGGLGPGVPDSFNIIDVDLDGNPVDPIPDNGRDLIDAGSGDDLVFGEDDADTIDGGTGDDTLDGGIDDDLIFGRAGDDLLIGGQGADTVDGGIGDDTIDIGLYTDPLTGDVYAEGVGDVIIGGEDPGDGDVDVLDLSDGGPLKVIFDDAIDPGGTSGEAGKVIFYKDAAQTEVAGELTFKEIENVIPCFTPGARIATPRGEVPVENLREGDKVITRDNGIQEIRWIGRRTLNRAELAQAPNLAPILIRAGALGHGLPERDMIVSPQHRILICGDRTQLYFEESEVLVAAKHLVNGGGIRACALQETTYVHFMFDSHEVVLSDGAWTESFQPGDQTLGAMGRAARAEILALFPELASRDGLTDYAAARRSLKAHEAKLLQL